MKKEKQCDFVASLSSRTTKRKTSSKLIEKPAELSRDVIDRRFVFFRRPNLKSSTKAENRFEFDFSSSTFENNAAKQKRKIDAEKNENPTDRFGLFSREIVCTKRSSSPLDEQRFCKRDATKSSITREKAKLRSLSRLNQIFYFKSNSILVFVWIRDEELIFVLIQLDKNGEFLK